MSYDKKITENKTIKACPNGDECELVSFDLYDYNYYNLEDTKKKCKYIHEDETLENYFNRTNYVKNKNKNKNDLDIDNNLFSNENTTHIINIYITNNNNSVFIDNFQKNINNIIKKYFNDNINKDIMMINKIPVSILWKLKNDNNTNICYYTNSIYNDDITLKYLNVNFNKMIDKMKNDIEFLNLKYNHDFSISYVVSKPINNKLSSFKESFYFNKFNEKKSLYTKDRPPTPIFSVTKLNKTKLKSKNSYTESDFSESEKNSDLDDSSYTPSIPESELYEEDFEEESDEEESDEEESDEEESDEEESDEEESDEEY
jgi:hypothetical protein